MNVELQQALAARLLALADDELILGHRNSEWCGHAPILEEDIAFANIALDEIGHAIVWYGLLAEVLGKSRETYPDSLVYQREASAFRSSHFVELPKGDWAFSMLRQYLFDVAEKLRLEALLKSTYPPLAEAAAKMRPEEIYHLRHTAAWVRRLGLGTEESQRRMQIALDQLWPSTLQLLALLPDETQLVEAGFWPDSTLLHQNWLSEVSHFLTESGLSMPITSLESVAREVHTEYLAPLLETLQEVARLYPEARW